MSSTAAGTPSDGSPAHGRLWTLPKTPVGWWAVGLTALIFPLAWTLMGHLIPWPILDTALAPVMLTLVIDAAAVVGLLAARRYRERSFLVILGLFVTVPLALFATFMILAHAIFPEG